MAGWRHRKPRSANSACILRCRRRIAIYGTLPRSPNGKAMESYPRLLQHILMQQSSTVERVWIIHAPENSPSGAGMTKAGLLPVGQLSFRSDGGVGLAPFELLERAQAGAALLGIPLIESVHWHPAGAVAARPTRTVRPSTPSPAGPRSDPRHNPVPARSS